MVSSEGEDLVFLLSLPRSGSTILSLLLGNHSRILCPPEPWFLLKVCGLSEPGNINSVFDDQLATTGTIAFLQGDVLFKAARAYAVTAYNSRLLASGKEIFVDKTPRYYHILPFINKLFPKARMIWLKRNPLDVALSYKTAWSIGTEQITGQEISPASYDFGVGLFNLAAFFDEPSGHKLEVQYEDLAKSPLTILGEICEFLRVRFEESMLDYAQAEDLISENRESTMGDKKALTTQSVNVRSIGRWREGLSETELRRIARFLGFDIFHRMGYGNIVDALQAQGIKACSESEAAEARLRVRASNVDIVGEMKGRLSNIDTQLQASEADRAARLETIREQGSRLGQLEGERNDLRAQLDELHQRFVAAETDRAARLETIREQGRRSGELEGERNDLRAELDELHQRFEAVEADRAARLEIVREQGRRLGELEGERNDLRAQLDELHQRFEAVEADRAARLEVIGEQEQRLQEVEQTLRGISQSRTYRLLRSVGRWAQVEQTLAQLKPGVKSSDRQVGTVLPVDYYNAIREPKQFGSVRYDPAIISNIIEDLQSCGYEVQPYRIDVADYRAYFDRAGYEDRYPDRYKLNLPEESLVHYVAAQLLELRTSDIYIDIGSEGSAAPEIYARLFGCTSYRQDQAYPEGFKGDTIGSDAANMPIPDAFATKMALHCSFEHFEGDSDIRFVKEVNRVLQPGGAVCIVPLYLFDHYVILTDPTVSVPQEVEFEDDATIYCDPTWGNRHARFYDPAHLMERVHRHLDGMTMKIYRITNATEVDVTCYMEFAALITKP